MRALGLNLLAATCVVSLTAITPSPTKSEENSVNFGFGLPNGSLIRDVGYRNWRYRYARPYWGYRYAYRPSYYRPYRRFGGDPGRYFGVGPGSYECYGYDCNW
jgi:hypothetical protein